MQSYTLKVEDKSEGQRLDLFLAVEFKDKFSRRYLQQIITDGHVLLNGKKVKTHHKLKNGDQIAIDFPSEAKTDIQPQDIPLDIVYEDSDLLVINKPYGMVVHPAPGNYSNTLVNALVHHCDKLSDINQSFRPGIVHRLDKDTSGLLLVAKNNQAHMNLAKQFQDHSIKKKYVALVHGEVEFDEGQIEAPVGRHPRIREKMAVTFKQSKEAKTIYRVIKRSKGVSLLELYPQTGRTHQLRVHLAYLGHPILGDKKYGKTQDRCRLALHAKSIGFVHPRTKKNMEFESELPAELKNLLQE
ncbi:MAG: RluA family pseudouridine synthase [Candidatus Omnitrophica bacterium]|nr:RluA family pseudouridine synthase [Candidatus Omnitrophota bacterium]